MSLLSTPASDVTWLISTFVERIPGVRQALVATADGSPLATSSGLGRSRAARLAGVAAGLAGLAPADADTGADATANASASASASAERGPTVTDLRIDTDQATLLVRHISDGSLLVVVADRSGDAVLIGYEMAALAERVGAVLTPALRAELLAALAG